MKIWTPQPIAQQSRPKWIFILLLVTFGGFVLAGFLVYRQNRLLKNRLEKPFRPSPTSASAVATYDQCVRAAGSLIQESYPQICVTSSGQKFTQPVNPDPGLQAGQ